MWVELHQKEEMKCSVSIFTNIIVGLLYIFFIFFSPFTIIFISKKSKRFLFAYHFFAINYENVYENSPFLTFYLSITIFRLLFTANFVIYT